MLGKVGVQCEVTLISLHQLLITLTPLLVLSPALCVSVIKQGFVFYSHRYTPRRAGSELGGSTSHSSVLYTLLGGRG